MKAKQLIFVIALVYTFAIAYLSLIDLAQTPVRDIGFSDKVLHGGAYFVMVLLWLFFAIFNSKTREIGKITGIICILAIFFGTFIEVLQHVLTDYRELDFYDIIANCTGAILAGLVVWILKDSLIRLKAKINLFLIKK